LGVSIQCGINNPAPAPGTIVGSGTVEVTNLSVKNYYFKKGGESYGYITFYYQKGNNWEKLTVSSPYGIKQGSGNTAPATGYTLSEEDVILGNSYFFKPDSLHYGRIDINYRLVNSTATVGFKWTIQTENDNRELY